MTIFPATWFYLFYDEDPISDLSND